MVCQNHQETSDKETTYLWSGMRLYRILLAAASVAVAVAGLPVSAGEPLTVAQGETLTFSSDTNFTAVTVHGTLNVTAGDFFVTNWSNGKRVETTVDLGPDAGDTGVMTVSSATLRESGNISYMTIRVGANGGGANAKLTVSDTRFTTSYLKEFQLAQQAVTSNERFEALEIGVGGDFLVRDVKNANAKPLVISFTGATTYGLVNFYANDLFFLPGGDIILKSVGDADIVLRKSGNDGVTCNLFNGTASNRNGYLRTEGSGSVTFNTTGRAFVPTFCINYPNVAWGHSGNFYIGEASTWAVGGLQVAVDNVLPYGSGTGGVIVRSAYDVHQIFLDLYGTSQRINSIETRRFCYVTNTSPDEAVLVFGTGGTDGHIKNVVLTNSAIRCEKTGSGTLTLDGAALNTLSGDGGAIYVASKTHVDTLALTNVALSFKGGDPSLLEVREWRIDPSVTLPMADGVATNCVFSFPAVPGATAATKDGSNFVTYMTPADAHGMALNVNGGVLRFGGEPCGNEWWRLVFKKAHNNGKTYTRADNGEQKFISVGLGSLGMFNGDGVSTIGALATYNKDAANDPANAHLLSQGQAVSKNPPFDTVNNASGIVGGGFATRSVDALLGTTNTFVNRYDHPCSTAAEATWLVKNFSWSVLYDGAVLDPENESTWEIVTWRTKSEWPSNPTSYALRKTVAWGHDNPHLTDWALLSSPDGVTWTTMDERSNQEWWDRTDAGSCGLNEWYQFTYNNHVPYLFNSRNADWRFTTFGPVSVAAGATLDLSNLRPENIAFNGLKVDMAAGAGRITHFAPAANGALYLENVAPAQSGGRMQLPLTVGTWISSANLASWSVYVNGVREPKLGVERSGDNLLVRRRSGFLMLVR